MSRRIVVLVALAVPLVSRASAQSFNLDVGDNLILYPLPANGYTAAAGQAGVWNNIKTPYSWTLQNLDGSTSSVTCASNSSSSYNDFPGTLTGDDKALMADLQVWNPFSAPGTWDFNGLQDGNYRVFTYAWGPGGSHPLTSVEVTGSSDPIQNVGGIWNGSPHVLGVTYALHHVTISGGTLHIVFQGVSNASGSINGFQIVYDGPPCTCASIFCVADGSGGSVPCPCGNNGSAGRGCDNSGATGGARLLSSGTTSPDTVVLNVTNELPTVPGIFLQGSLPLGAPVTFGDGTRCIGGVLKRLAVKTAVGGAASFPQAGDPSITTQSANLGDPIAPGSTRYYQAYYRDSDLSFCVAAPSTFNVSQAISIVW
jgi:hypothetical protein